MPADMPAWKISWESYAFLRAFLPRRIIFSLHCLYRIDEETNILTGFLSFGVKIVIIVHVNCAGKKL